MLSFRAGQYLYINIKRSYIEDVLFFRADIIDTSILNVLYRDVLSFRAGSIYTSITNVVI